MGRVNYLMGRPDPFSSIVLGTSPFSCAPPKPANGSPIWVWAVGDRLRLVCAMLVNNDILTVNYGVKQSQFTKPTSEPRASDPEESNETFGARLENDYCSFTVANHQLITVIKFVVKSYTRP